MPGLQRIILIDTHLPGVVELKLNGHTNICGTNASGKTTLQRLIPVFYGEYPSRVVPATRDSFERWYLPRESSFIIYEYARAEGDSCQVVLSSNGNGVQYRFIAKPFDLSDYLYQNKAGEHNSVSMNELARTLKRSNVLVTNLLNTKEFRAIIQHDRSTLTSSANSRELLGYARIFSLSGSTGNLRHIEKLAKAVHSKEGKMETIKAMIAAILEEDGVQPPSSNLSRQRVEDWIRESHLIQEFDAIRPEFVKLEQADDQLSQAELRLATMQQQFSIDLSLLAANIVESDGQLNDVIHNIKTNEKQWNDDRDTLNQDLSEAKADVKKLTTDLDQVEAEFDQWQDQNIDSLQQNLQQLPQWQTELESLNSHYLLLTEKHQDVESAYHKRLADLNEKLQQELEHYNQQIQQLQQQHGQQKQAEQTDLQNIRDDYSQQRQQLKSDFGQQLQALKIEQAELSSSLKNAGFNEFEQSQLDLLDATINEATIAEDGARENLSKAQQASQQLNKQRQQQREELDNTHRRQQQQQQQVDKIEALLYPGDNTLLEFLRHEQPGWENKLGKVINPDLLKRKDLKPQVGEDSESLFGLTLDLHNLDAPEYAQSEQQLQAQLSQAKLQLDELIEQHNQAELSLAKASEALRNCEQSQTKAESACRNAEANRKRAQHDREQSRQEYLAALAERKQQAKKRQQKNQQEQSKLEAQQAQALDNLHDQQTEAEAERQFHWQQIIADIDSQISQLSNSRDKTRNNAELERKKCEQWLQDELNKRGVDIDEIGGLQKQIKKLKDDIQHTEVNRHKVKDYQHWYKTVFSGHKVTWQNQLEKAKKAASHAERELQKQQTAYHHQREADKARQVQLEQRLRTGKEQQESIQTLHHSLTRLKLPAAPKTDDKFEPQQYGQRISEGQELLQQREQLLADVRNYVEHFDKLIAQQAGTGLSDTWDKSREESTSINPQGLRLLDHRKLVSHLSRLLNEIVPQKLAGLREQGRIFGADLSQYYHVLADIDKRIAGQSTRISKEVDEELFLDGVSESAVKIRSKISELEFWPELSQFQKLYDEWIQSGASQLPQDDYAQSMRRVMDILGRAALGGGINNLLDIELHLKEGNSHLVIRTDRQLNESSSHGMAYLILCKFLLAFTRLLRGSADVTIHWPIDELGTLHQSNVKKIFDACHNNDICVLGAFPNPESEVLTLFANRYLIDKNTRQLQIVQPRTSAISERLKQRQQLEKIA
ncbi:ATP-binding protein [Alteromonadaceae bacterium BrNp21-10]|nr:ATP-binding protein [Alteromonadaceae bacterium BrNp21-10]